MVVSARAAIVTDAQSAAMAAESIKRCLFKSNLIVRQRATLKLRYPAFLRHRRGPLTHPAGLMAIPGAGPAGR